MWIPLHITVLSAFLWHLLYDWHWQGDFIAKTKGKSWVIMTVHCLTWTVGLSLIIGLLRGIYWWTPIMLFTGHYIMDQWKCDMVRKKEDELNEKFLKLEATNCNQKIYAQEWEIDEKAKMLYFHKLIMIDQIFHVAQIIVALA